MANTYNITENRFWIFALIAIITLFLIIVYFFYVIVPFVQVRKYIKMEMRRSDGDEYKYWENRLKKLYKENIPIIGRFLR